MIELYEAVISQSSIKYSRTFIFLLFRTVVVFLFLLTSFFSTIIHPPDIFAWKIWYWKKYTHDENERGRGGEGMRGRERHTHIQQCTITTNWIVSIFVFVFVLLFFSFLLFWNRTQMTRSKWITPSFILFMYIFIFYCFFLPLSHLLIRSIVCYRTLSLSLSLLAPRPPLSVCNTKQKHSAYIYRR